jgi:hypothetical protein
VTTEEWWLDPSTRNFIYSVFEPDKTITFTVCESRPLKLNGAEVGLQSYSSCSPSHSVAFDLFSELVQMVAADCLPVCCRLQRCHRSST